ncbi:hypothetical protein Avbf_14208 [Armadillidium vulgare]|nr:hypothetical protein Avbf_14208 [Armadillidium vulgare]
MTPPSMTCQLFTTKRTSNTQRSPISNTLKRVKIIPKYLCGSWTWETPETPILET